MQESMINLRGQRNGYQPQPSDQRPSENMPKEGRSGRWGMFFAIFFLAVLVIGAAGGGAWWTLSHKKERANDAYIDPSKYQAVFLTNGQVYFGKASDTYGKYVRLSEVYYLINGASLQNQKPEGENAENGQNKQGADYSLIKLGKELNGPEDMEINSDQIILIENMSDDSKLVNAIRSMKK